MVDLRTLSTSDLSTLIRGLRRIGVETESMEEGAQRVTALLHEQLADAETGERQTALVRLYKTHPYDSLPAAVRAHLDQRLGGPAPSGMRCLTLLGTSGLRPEWNDRRRSVDHQAIPLLEHLPGQRSQRLWERTPLVGQLLRELGVQQETFSSSYGPAALALSLRQPRLFFVQNTVNHPLLPMQTEFVVPEGVRSVVGLSAALESSDLFVLMLFSRVPLTPETAALLLQLTASVKMAALSMHERVFAVAPSTS